MGPCPLCGGTDRSVVGSVAGYVAPIRYEIAVCGRCGSSSALLDGVGGPPGGLYEAIYEQAPVLGGYDRYVAYALVAEHTPKRALAYLAATEDVYWAVRHVVHERRAAGLGTRILEVGSGLGYLTAALRAEGFDARGVDLSEAAVAQATARFGPHYTVGDAREVCADDPCDVVVALEIVEHVEEPAAFVASLLALVSSGGEVVVSTPDRSRFDATTRWAADNPPVHLHWISHQGIGAVAAAAGASVELVDFTTFNAALGRTAGPPPHGEPTPDHVLDEDLRAIAPGSGASLPSARDRLLRHPWVSPFVGTVRRWRSGGAPASTSYSLVARFSR